MILSLIQISKATRGPVEPPQQKGGLFQYAQGKLIEENSLNQVEELGMFKCHEDIDVTVE